MLEGIHIKRSCLRDQVGIFPAERDHLGVYEKKDYSGSEKHSLHHSGKRFMTN